MLPLYDASLDPQTYNIFQPIEKMPTYDLPKLAAIEETISISEQISPFKKPTKTDLYCKACKKKFNSELTFANHIKSAKHIAGMKKIEGGVTAASQNQPTIATSTNTVLSPQVQDALSKLDQVQDSTIDPDASIILCWNQAQTLYALKQPQYTEKALKLMISLLSMLPITKFSPAQITSFLYNGRLALARLLCIYQQLSESQDVYLDALDGKWKLSKGEVLDISQNVRTLRVSELLLQCDKLAFKYLNRERNRTKPAPPLTDLNNSITTVLNEASNAFSRKRHSERTAIVLYATCSIVCQFERLEGGWTSQKFYSIIAQVYKSMGGLKHRLVEIRLLDEKDLWSIYLALLMCIEIDDLVRGRRIYDNLINRDEYNLYPDVKLLCDLYQSKLTLQCCNTLLEDLDYVNLLLTSSKEFLLLRSRTRVEQLDLLKRIRDII